MPVVTKKQKLELTSIGKESGSRLEPRILLEDPEKLYRVQQRVTDHDHFDTIRVPVQAPSRDNTPAHITAGAKQVRRFVEALVR
jgi:hypothetical protein